MRLTPILRSAKFKLTLESCVYGAGKEKFAGAWQNKDGKRVDDGRYSRFIKKVSKDLKGADDRVITDPLRLFAYGTDASFYRLNPKVVVKVHDESEVQMVLQHARECNTPVTFRAAGTSLSGQAITDSVLIKISHAGKKWRRHTIHDSGRSITLEPGLIGGEVNSLLKDFSIKHNVPQMKLGPDPASLESCMIGGIFNNNSSGMCCGVDQNTYHTMQDIRVVLLDGTILDTSDPASVASFTTSHAPLLEGLSSLAASVQSDESLVATISKKFKIKCTTGYSINALVDHSPNEPIEILKKILVGSEGTLAFLSKVSYRTVPEHPHRASAFLMFPNMHAACSATALLKVQGYVDAAELFDRASLREGEKDTKFPKVVKGVMGCSEDAAGVLVEVRAPTEAGVKEKIEACWTLLEEKGIQFLNDDMKANEFHFDPAVFNVLWDMRKGLIPKVGGARKKGTVMLIEDVACPIHHLADMTLDLIQMFKTHNYPDACIFGHALDGNLHLLFSQSFNSDADLEQYSAMMNSMGDIVAKRYQGSLKGEHGTGRNIASYVEMEWGSKAYEVMKSVKSLFDPLYLLNPGVLLNDDPHVHVKSLKVMPPAHDLIDRCIECGFCESNCPSKDLTMTPRQRITTYREMARLKALKNPTKEDTSRLWEFEKGYAYNGDQTCAADGMCQEKCPVSIDTGKLIKTIRQTERKRDQGVTRLIASMLANNFRVTAAMTRLVLTAVKVLRTIGGDKPLKAGSKLMRTVVGSTGPVYTEHIPGPARKMPKVATQGDGRKVIYYPSCVARMMGPAKQDEDSRETMIKIMERAGYEVVIPKQASSMCCGMMFDSRGCCGVGNAKRNDAVKILQTASQNGKIPIVCETSPCVKAFNEGGLMVYDPVQFLWHIRKELVWKRVEKEAMVHVPCSSKKMGSASLFMDIANRCATTVHPTNIPCCGTAGDRGLRFPELPLSSLQNLVPSPSSSMPCYSTSRTCEVGLSNSTGVSWRSLIGLVERATRQ
eukprot:TRINITY_DN24204_c0_g1_i1.p1 TRINITY_DN24204_c0_g1~~TRINITY_DN24204_c0_g1_i1.p1  ORF type:complete len:1020 (+),score=225.38 TRINITY_DN24204_c0_g1_i1:59-3061(+)